MTCLPPSLSEEPAKRTKENVVMLCGAIRSNGFTSCTLTSSSTDSANVFSATSGSVPMLTPTSTFPGNRNIQNLEDPLVTWLQRSWVARQLARVLKDYPSGVTDTILISELENQAILVTLMAGRWVWTRGFVDSTTNMGWSCDATTANVI